MHAHQKLIQLKDSLKDELLSNIVPYWLRYTIDYENGGFVGRIDNDNNIIDKADKSAVLNARILWSFSSLYNTLGDEKYLHVAERANQYIMKHFHDTQNGGFFWTLDYSGHPIDKRKHLYVQAFMLYGMSEYQKAVADSRLLQQNFDFFHLLEDRCFDNENLGYHEVFSPDWEALKHISLGSDEQAAKFTMNSHLHLMEAYTNLFKIHPDEYLKNRLQYLVELHIDNMYDPEITHFYSFFLEQWRPQAGEYSYGHDIEAVWLLYDAIQQLEHPELYNRIKTITGKVADVTLEEGIDEKYGGIYNSGENGVVKDTDKQWWSQIEGVLGFGYALMVTGKPEYSEAINNLWKFISTNFIDRSNGEWYFKARRDGTTYQNEDKVGPWKGPYHTVRGCLVFEDIMEMIFSESSDDRPLCYKQNM